MRVASWNVNGIRARQVQVLELIARDEPDVLCLQELKARRDQIPEALTRVPGYHCYSHGGWPDSGVGLLVRDRLTAEASFSHPHFDYENRIVELILGDLALASVYVPNGGKDFEAKMRFLEKLEEYAASAQEKRRRLILCGDINIARTERDV